MWRRTCTKDLRVMHDEMPLSGRGGPRATLDLKASIPPRALRFWVTFRAAPPSIGGRCVVLRDFAVVGGAGCEFGCAGALMYPTNHQSVRRGAGVRESIVQNEANCPHLATGMARAALLRHVARSAPNEKPADCKNVLRRR